jgi:hypothetical protein
MQNRYQWKNSSPIESRGYSKSPLKRGEDGISVRWTFCKGYGNLIMKNAAAEKKPASADIADAGQTVSRRAKAIPHFPNGDS